MKEHEELYPKQVLKVTLQFVRGQLLRKPTVSLKNVKQDNKKFLSQFLMTVHGLSRSIKRKRRSGENNSEPIAKEVMNLKDFLKQVLSAYSEENSDEKEEKVEINMKKETPEETNEKDLIRLSLRSS